VMAVLVVLEVRLIMLLVVRDEILDGEPVMRGNEIDARPWPPAAMIEHVGPAEQATRGIRHRALVTLPVGADSVAIATVPFRESRRKATQLKAVRADVPRFRDQLDRLKDGVLTDHL